MTLKESNDPITSSQSAPKTIPDKKEETKERKPVKRGFTSGLGMGFSLNDDQNTVSQKDNSLSYMIGKENIADEISIEKLNNILDEFINSLGGQASLQSVLKENKPQLISPTEIEFKLYNEAQEKGLKEHGEALLMKLRTRLNNYKLKFTIKILETKVFKAAGPMDKYERMAKQNPNLRKLKEQLNLEIEF